MSNKPSLFSELRRRNVFRVALTYAVVAWLLIEIASVLLPLIDAPESIITAFVVLLALGFLVALFISWAFEMTPEGLKRTQDLSPDDIIPYWSRRKFATFIFGVAGIAFCLSAYHLLFPAPARNLSKTETVSTLESSSSGSDSEKTSGSRSVEQLLRDLDAKWAKAAAAKDVEQTIAFYSDDAIVFPPNAPSAATKETIRNGWKEMLTSPGFVISWQPTRVRVGKAGEMAWVGGEYELTMNDASGKPITDRGKYLEVWEKQSDGNWKCRADMWNSDLPSSASATAQQK
ncbi:MAG: YybH family protein [Nitrospirota bacterium]|jgi:ketosteroid isomerase-like protein